MEHGAIDQGMNAALLQGCAFLAATSLLVPAFRRLRLSAVMAFLVIGLLLGPQILGRFAASFPWIAVITLDPEGPARWLAELGVVFLLFNIGLEVSSERLWALRRLVLGLGLAQVLLTGLAIGAVAYAFQAGPAAAAVTGLALSLSSTAVVLQLLTERRQLAGTVGRASFSVLLLQDLAVIPILFAVAALSDGPKAGTRELAEALGAAALTIAGILVVGRHLVRPFFRWAAGIASREVFVAATLLVIIATAGAAAAAGLSMALGAFLAGLLLAETEFRHEIQADIEPYKGLLLGLFFVTVGMRINLGLIPEEPFLILLGLLGLTALKAALAVPLARGFGLSWPQATETGFLLAQAGEFAFVIITLAEAGGIFPPATADYMLLVVALSIFIAPGLAGLGTRLARLLEEAGARAGPENLATTEGHVVIAGYGRVGQALGALLQGQELAHVALDLDAESVARLRHRGWPVHYGDASRPDVLARMGADRAAAIVVTMDSKEAVERVTRTVRRAWPGVPVFARAHDPAQARRLHEAGAAYATPETIEATLQLGEALLGELGIPGEATRRVIDERRAVERARALHGAER
jgi:monovalent cation:proton antiporter-2 (CPA2) family protein